MPLFRLSRLVLLMWLLLCVVALSGCQEWMKKIESLLGDKAGKVNKAATRPRVNPQLEKRRKEALEQVQQGQARAGWTIKQEVENYQKIAAKLAKKKQLPKPTGFDWAAICSGGATCKVVMGFWDGRTRHEAVWLLSGKEIEPLNCWAMSFMARSKDALACFQREAKGQKSVAPKARDDNDAVWETSASAAKAAATGSPSARPSAAPTPRR